MAEGRMPAEAGERMAPEGCPQRWQARRGGRLGARRGRVVDAPRGSPTEVVGPLAREQEGRRQDDDMEGLRRGARMTRFGPYLGNTPKQGTKQQAPPVMVL